MINKPFNLNPNGQMKYFFLIILSALFQSFAVAFSKLAANVDVSQIVGLYTNVYFLLMIICLAFQAISWTFTLKYFKLSYAYPMLSMSLIFNSFIAVYVFKEVYTLKSIFGLLCIFLGVVLLLSKREIDNA